MTIVALDIDAQKGFSPLCPDELPIAEALAIVPALNAHGVVAEYRVLTKDAHNPRAVWVRKNAKDAMQPLPYPDADLTWPLHCVTGTYGFAALPGLPRAQDYDFLVYKGVENDMHPYGACFHDLREKISTGLLEWLAAKKADIILIGGLATDYCVKNTVLQLKKNSAAKVVVDLAACRGVAADTIATAIHEMQEAGAIVVKTMEKAIYSACHRSING